MSYTAPRRLFLSIMCELASGMLDTSKQPKRRVRSTAVFYVSVYACTGPSNRRSGRGRSGLSSSHAPLVCVASASAASERLWKVHQATIYAIEPTALAALALAHRCATKSCSLIGYCFVAKAIPQQR